MKRSVKVNGRSYTFDIPRNTAMDIDTTLRQLAASKAVKYDRKAKAVVGIDGRLVAVPMGDERPAVLPLNDKDTVSGPAAIADVVVQLGADDLPEAATEQLAEIVTEAGIDLKSAVTTV